MNNFNLLLGRHSHVALPGHQYRIVLKDEGFVLVLDGCARRIQEEDKSKTYRYHCTVRTSLVHLETLLANPEPAKVMPLMLTGKIKIEPGVPHILGLAVALNDTLKAEKARVENRAP